MESSDIPSRTKCRALIRVAGGKDSTHTCKLSDILVARALLANGTSLVERQFLLSSPDATHIARRERMPGPTTMSIFNATFMAKHVEHAANNGAGWQSHGVTVAITQSHTIRSGTTSVPQETSQTVL